MQVNLKTKESLASPKQICVRKNQGSIDFIWAVYVYSIYVLISEILRQKRSVNRGLQTSSKSGQLCC